MSRNWSESTEGTESKYIRYTLNTHGIYVKVRTLIHEYLNPYSRLLMNKLDEVGDDFRDTPMAALYEVQRLSLSCL